MISYDLANLDFVQLQEEKCGLRRLDSPSNPHFSS